MRVLCDEWTIISMHIRMHTTCPPLLTYLMPIEGDLLHAGPYMESSIAVDANAGREAWTKASRLGKP